MNNSCFLHCAFFSWERFSSTVIFILVNTSNKACFLLHCFCFKNILVSWQANGFKEKKKRPDYKSFCLLPSWSVHVPLISLRTINNKKKKKKKKKELWVKQKWSCNQTLMNSANKEVRMLFVTFQCYKTKQ